MKKFFQYRLPIILSIVFFVFILYNGLCFCINEISKNPNNYPRLISWNVLKNYYIETYGGIQRFLGKQQIENFTIFKNSYEKLVEPRNGLTDSDIENKITAFFPIIDYLTEKEIPYIYIRSLLPIVSENDLPEGVKDSSHDNFSKTGKALELYGVKTIDLTSDLETLIPKESLFYRTDHHWSGDTSFYAYKILCRYLNEKEIIKATTEEGLEFNRNNIEKSFLGSYGIKVGKYYAGKDDYVYYTPLKQTDMEFIAFKENGTLLIQQRGEWFETFMDQNILNNVNYNNKYDAFLYGNGGVNILKNNNTLNSKKLLLIAHSYGRPLAAYLSLHFSEIHHIDPQRGRFSGKYLNYIDEYNPDFVIFLNEFEGEIIGEYSLR